MARRTLENRQTRKLMRGATSYLVALPIDAIRALGWQKAQKVVVEFDRAGKRLIITDWKK